jgi:lipopolysaccharide export system permease protein
MSRRILDKYIAKTVLSAIALVTLMLIGLQIFILFVNQLEDLGKLDYGIVQATVFVLLQMPYQVYLFFPMASLLGCLIGLGVLANHSELVVMRAAGMSISQITTSVLKTSLLVILFITSIGELLVPFMAHYANNYKMSALTGGQTLRTAQGIWMRYGNDFISVGEVLPNNVLHHIYQFRFDDQHNLRLAREIKEARFVDQSWMAYEVKQTEFFAHHTKATPFKSLAWDVPVKSNILMISSIEPDEMTLHELNRYLREQKRSKQSVHTYKLAFYQRIVQPFTTMVMMVLAIPFIFGPLRSSTMGSKLLVGATVGFSFHIVNRFFGPVSTVFQWPAELAALGPTVVFALLGVYLMRRVR